MDAELHPQLAAGEEIHVHDPANPVLALPPQYDASMMDHFEMGSDGAGPVFGTQEWPSEILDSMTWSAQFFDAVRNAPLSPFQPG